MPTKVLDEVFRDGQPGIKEELLTLKRILEH